ncbi:hypothetical protein Ciccas_012537, partial [Cichlidogyrus casuarinus]
MEDELSIPDLCQLVIWASAIGITFISISTNTRHMNALKSVFEFAPSFMKRLNVRLKNEYLLEISFLNPHGKECKTLIEMNNSSSLVNMVKDQQYRNLKIDEQLIDSYLS